VREPSDEGDSPDIFDDALGRSSRAMHSLSTLRSLDPLELGLAAVVLARLYSVNHVKIGQTIANLS
jgi:hypothetical protein